MYVFSTFVCAILPAKAVPEMIYTLSGGTLNPTHSLTFSTLSLVYLHFNLGVGCSRE